MVKGVSFPWAISAKDDASAAKATAISSSTTALTVTVAVIYAARSEPSHDDSGEKLMLSDLMAIESVLARARCPEDVFGALPSGADKLVWLKKAYHRIAIVVHPDKYNKQPEESQLAAEVFGKLTDWRARAEIKIKQGTYGDSKPYDPPLARPKMNAQIIQTPKRKYIVTDLIAEGDLADVYRCTYEEDSKENQAAFKIAQSADDNDLMENEARVLGTVYAKKQKEERFYRYLPKPLDSFALRPENRASGREPPRRVNVIQLADGFVPLSAVMTAYPKGLDYRDVIWIFKRNLACLWYVHRQKLVVHGAVLPAHLLVHPIGHGAKIVDWCYAVEDWPNGTERVKAISKTHRAYYAPEILAKKPVTPQTDIYMLGKVMVALLGGDVASGHIPDAVPKQIRAFISSLIIENQSRRPDDAGKLHEEFDVLLASVVGKQKYRPLEMPMGKTL
jgi:Protein kinase domain